MMLPSARDGFDTGHAAAGEPLPLPPRPAPHLVVFRGELRGPTGYGALIRALAKELALHMKVAGVEIHHSAAGGVDWDFPMMSDDDLRREGVRAPGSTIVVNYTTPNNYIYVEGATNVGALVWETVVLPRLQEWPEHIAAMDRMLAPTSFNRQLLEACGYTDPVDLVAWPHDFDRGPQHDLSPLAGLQADLVETLDERAIVAVALADLKTAAATIFLAVQSVAPRKGLPALLAAWRDHVQARGNEDLLLLKLRFTHASGRLRSPAAHLTALLAQAGFRPGERTRVALIPYDLTETQMRALYGLSDAYVTATYGEGFGGPLIEALQAWKPVVAGRHTGAGDLLSADYPYRFESEELAVGLGGALSFYPPSSRWHVPRHASLVEALGRLSLASTQDRAEVVGRARAHAARFCGREAVGSQLTEVLSAWGVYR